MAQKKRQARAGVTPITAAEVDLIRQRISPLLKDHDDLAQKFDTLLENWNAAQKASIEKDVRLYKIRRTLLLAMGILPSSEKQSSSEPTPPGSKKGEKPRSALEKLIINLEKARQRAKYYRNLTRSLIRKLRRLRSDPKRQKSEDAVNLDSQSDKWKYDPSDLANEPVTSEDEAQDKADMEDLERCMKLGNGSDPKFGLLSAQLIARGISTPLVTERAVLVEEADLPHGAINVSSFTEERRRYDCRMQVTAIDLSVEKRVVLVNGEREVITADVSEIGPAKMKVTWGFLAQVTVLTTQYALPFNRLALMLSTQKKEFKSAEICRYFGYVAERFLPLYLHYFKRLANASSLSGDDADSLVLEIQRALASVKNSLDHPWENYRTIDKATEELAKITAQTDSAKDEQGQKPRKATLALLTAEHMGFEAMRADGKGAIKSFKTTLLKGRSDDDDPNSLIVFYRSHLGGLGNLLDAMLQSRSTRAPRKLHLQTDLSTVNLALSPEVKKRIEIVLYGCLSHVRRPFKRNRDENPMICDAVLAALAQVFLNERMLSLHGRNAENIVAVRRDHSLPWLDVVDELCHMAKDLYPAAHPLGQGARYFLRHPKELRRFIDNPMMAPSNDESEQMIRMESLIAANSHFRQSIEGRIQFDICRTVAQTALSAGCSVSDYIEWYLKQDPQAISKNPQDYTPLAYNRMSAAGEKCDENGSRREDVDQTSSDAFPAESRGPPPA